MGRVFAAKVRHPAAEAQVLRHIPADQLGEPVRPAGGFSTNFLHRRDSAPGIDGLRYSAWAAAGLPFRQVLGDYFSECWDGEAKIQVQNWIHSHHYIVREWGAMHAGPTTRRSTLQKVYCE